MSVTDVEQPKLIGRSFGFLLTEPEFGSPTTVEGDAFVVPNTNNIDLMGTFSRGADKVEFSSIHDLVTKAQWQPAVAQAFVQRLQARLQS